MVHIAFVLKLLLVLLVWDAPMNFYRFTWKDIFHQHLVMHKSVNK